MATINVLLTSFSGLSLPPTLSLPLSADLPISSFAELLAERLPADISAHRLVLSTNSNKQINPSSNAPLSSLLTSKDADFLPIRLSAPLCGGKGGFGSQLRAAGGRMSSRKNRNQQRDVNGSNRNLDGRRLRTITEAKNLAEYLAVKPEMDRKEKEERRQRWEAVVDAAERKEAEIKRGKGNVRVDGEWVEAKEEVENKTRDAIKAAMMAGLIGKENERAASESSGSAENEDAESEAEAERSGSGSSVEDKSTKATQTGTFFGWDDDDEDMSEDDEELDERSAPEPEYKGKGKGRA